MQYASPTPSHMGHTCTETSQEKKTSELYILP